MGFSPLPGAFGRLALLLAAAQVPPLALALADSDAPAARGFALGAACALFFGGVLALAGRGGRSRLGPGETLVLAVAGWGLAGLLAAVPFVLSDAAPNFARAIVEAVSGVTATGLSVIGSLDSTPRAIVLWRAMLQWMGGAATLVFAAALAPRLALAAPGAGPDDAFRPRLRRVAVAAGLVYAVLTAVAAAALALAGVAPFDAACYAMSGLSTGGFAPDDAGPAGLGKGARAVLMLAMIAGALNLAGAWRAGAARSGAPAGRAELGLFLVLAAAGAGAVATAAGGGDAAWRGLFAAISALTTTGFSAGLEPTAPAFAVLALAGLALIGGARGSTAGGLKLSRALLLLRRARRELERLAHPHRAVPAGAGHDIWAFFVLYILVMTVLTLVLAAHGAGFEPASILALSALTNTGPLLAEAVGADADLASLAWSGDLAIAAAMLAGRLEGFALIVALTPLFRRR